MKKEFCIENSERWVLKNALFSWKKALENWEEKKRKGRKKEKEVAKVVYVLRYGETRGILQLLNAKFPNIYIDLDYDVYREDGSIVLIVIDEEEVERRIVI